MTVTRRRRRRSVLKDKAPHGQSISASSVGEELMHLSIMGSHRGLQAPYPELVDSHNITQKCY